MAKKEIWEVLLTKPAEKIFDKSKSDMKKRLARGLDELEQNPLYGPNIRPLTGQLKGLYRYRVGTWRIICRLRKEEKINEIIAILVKGDAY
jgi:mRNA interferase RelE/StbE